MNPMREWLTEALAGTGAFLRCDRGEGLYVTNLPARCSVWPDYARKMEQAGFAVRASGSLLQIIPHDLWAQRFVEWAQRQGTPSELTRVLARRRAEGVCPEERAAWLTGVKQLELPCATFDYEKMVRQSAAVALRTGGGALLQACGLCLDLLRRETYAD